MLATRWDPLFGVNRLQCEMEQLFQDMRRQAPQYEQRSFPPLNLSEDAEHYYVEAELPGLALDDLELQVSGGNQLHIKGERKRPEPEQANWHRQERAYGGFDRTVELPAGVDAEKVSATLTNGVLTISLAKSQAAKPRKISVKAE